MDSDLNRAIDSCVEAVARLQSALFSRTASSITRYEKQYHAAFAKLRICLPDDAGTHLDQAAHQRLRTLEMQHRRMMRIGNQSMALTQEDLTLIEQGIAKLNLAESAIAEG